MKTSDKQKKLEAIAREIEKCRQCRKGKHGKAVPGEGSPNAKIAFIGEAPGREEAKTGRPFIGRSGKLLRSLIRDAGLREQDVFITSPVKYLPDRGTPSADDIAHGRIHLSKQLDIIDPKFVVLLKLDRKSKYHAMIDIIDALNQTNLNRYSLAPMTDIDKKEMSKATI